MAAAGAAAAATTAAAAAEESEAYWTLFKHQVRLSAGLLKSQYERGSNLLLAPNALISSLSTLVPGRETESRIDLAKMLFYTKCNGRMETNDLVDYYCQANKHNLKRNMNSLSVNSFYYSHPSLSLKPKLVKKLEKKYRAAAKELKFVHEKPNLQALETINADAQLTATCSPMMSTADYVMLMDSSVRTVLSTALKFNGLWSKSFEVTYGEFHRSDGTSVKTQLLVKKKSYLYYYDALTIAKAVQIHASPESTLQLVLILPDENISADHYIHHMLNYDTLKRIFKKLKKSSTTRSDVQLTLPKFTLTARTQISKPIQTLALKDILELNQAKSGKALKLVDPVDENLVLLQKATIDVQERGVDKKKSKTAGGLFSKRAQVNFIANRPFIFALVTRGDERQIVMMGVCEDPTKNI